MADARGCDDYGHIHAGRAAGGRGLVQDDLERRRDSADEGRVRRGSDLDLEAARAFGGVVLGGLSDDGAHGLLAADRLPRRIVGALEAEPPALVCRHLYCDVVRQPLGQADALSLGHSLEGAHAHRPREVQVKMCLGEAVEIAHAYIFPYVEYPDAGSTPRSSAGRPARTAPRAAMNRRPRRLRAVASIFPL